MSKAEVLCKVRYRKFAGDSDAAEPFGSEEQSAGRGYG